MKTHPRELTFLKSMKTQITWINHTLNHPYDPSLGLANNFLLMKDVSAENEIIENEKLMLSYGLTPSIFCVPQG